MPVSPKLVEMLVCPITRQSVSVLDSESLNKLNRLIKEHGVKTLGGSVIETILEEVLITRNHKTIYPVHQGIPLMMEDHAIAVEQIPDW